MNSEERTPLSTDLRARFGVGEGGAKTTLDAAHRVAVEVLTFPDERATVEQAIESVGGTVEGGYGTTVQATLRAGTIPTLADHEGVRFVDRYREPAPVSVTEGVDIIGADALHDRGYTGDGATIGVIDHEIALDNPKYEDQIVATIGNDSGYYEGTSGYTSEPHGTASTEVVSDVAPDADLVLASTFSESIYTIIDELAEYDVDVATMSLEFYPRRIDGRDDLSNRIAEFTDGGRLFTTAAGNQGLRTWHGEFVDTSGNDLMEFPEYDERLPYSLADGEELIIHWDTDYDTATGSEYVVRVYEEEGDDTPLAAPDPQTVPYQGITFDSSDRYPDLPDDGTVWVEVERVDGTGDEVLDFTFWSVGDITLSSPALTKDTRSVHRRPAPSIDENTLTVGAVQATDEGLFGQGDLAVYSSRGPTQTGERGVDIVAPTQVSNSEWGYGSTGYRGTSAATPHVGGAIALLSAATGATNDQIREAIFETGRPIPDDSVDDPGAANVYIGFGYLDADAALDGVEVPETTLEVTDNAVAVDETAIPEIAVTRADAVHLVDLWSDWTVSTDVPAEHVDDAVSEAGTVTVTWEETRNEATLTPIIDLPERYVGGEYLLTVTVEGPEKTLDETLTVTIK